MEPQLSSALRVAFSQGAASPTGVVPSSGTCCTCRSWSLGGRGGGLAPLLQFGASLKSPPSSRACPGTAHLSFSFPPIRLPSLSSRLLGQVSPSLLPDSLMGDEEFSNNWIMRSDHKEVIDSSIQNYIWKHILLSFSSYIYMIIFSQLWVFFFLSCFPVEVLLLIRCWNSG